jgi:hypothetical protein
LFLSYSFKPVSLRCHRHGIAVKIGRTLGKSGRDVFKSAGEREREREREKRESESSRVKCFAHFRYHDYLVMKGRT